MKRYRSRGTGGYHGEKNRTAVLIPALFAGAASAVLFALYYFFGMTPVLLAGSAGVILTGCMVSFLTTKNYDSLLIYTVSFLALFGAGWLIFFNLLFRWMPAEPGLYWMPVYAAFLVSVFGTVVRIFVRSRKIRNFNRFFILSCVALGAVYLGIVIYGLFLSNSAFSPVTEKMQWIPFATLSEYIEDLIRGEGSLSAVVFYLLPRLLLYVPYGFYISVLLRENAVLLRLPLLLILPVGAEWAQRQFGLGGADIDDIIFGIIGGIAGVLIYSLIDFISRKCVGRRLLERESAYGSFGGYRI